MGREGCAAFYMEAGEVYTEETRIGWANTGSWGEQIWLEEVGNGGVSGSDGGSRQGWFRKQLERHVLESQPGDG